MSGARFEIRTLNSRNFSVSVLGVSLKVELLFYSGGTLQCIPCADFATLFPCGHFSHIHKSPTQTPSVEQAAKANAAWSINRIKWRHLTSS